MVCGFFKKVFYIPEISFYCYPLNFPLFLSCCSSSLRHFSSHKYILSSLYYGITKDLIWRLYMCNSRDLILNFLLRSFCGVPKSKNNILKWSRFAWLCRSCSQCCAECLGFPDVITMVQSKFLLFFLICATYVVLCPLHFLS